MNTHTQPDSLAVATGRESNTSPARVASAAGVLEKRGQHGGADRAPVTVQFLGMQEHPAGAAHAFPLFNTAEGHTLSEDGLRKMGLRTPPELVREDLEALMRRHWRASHQAIKAEDADKHDAQAEAIWQQLRKEAA
jgi:hypothetical protein